MSSQRSVTRELAAQARGLSFERLSEEAIVVGRHCLLDWLGTTLAGSREPLTEILRRQLRPGRSDGESTLIGEGMERTTSLLAALVNGSASHALDFDDTHTAMSGHPSVPVIPAALALAEARGRSGAELLTAIVAGIELECRLGAIVNPGHYAAGFHATGTIGTFGAAAACAHLLDLDEQRWLHALGLAGTQAAGLKSSFGTMAKPFHAGKAAHDGLLAALLAEGGFTGNARVVESRQGFAHTQHGDGDAATALDTLDRLRDRFLVRDTLFKYHAACYLTHSAIDAVRALRADGLVPAEVEAVTVEVPRSSLDVCNIESPATGLEGKFSLRATIALGLLGHDTADLATFSDARMKSHELVTMRDRVTVATKAGTPPTATPLTVRTRDGRERRAVVDVGVAAVDLAAQDRRLGAKFLGLAAPVVGGARAEELRAAVLSIETAPDLGALLAGGRAVTVA